MGKLEQIMIRAVQLETRGWIVHFGQKCPACGTPNIINKYNTMIECGRCESSFIMDNPTIQASGGRQNGLARRVSD